MHISILMEDLKTNYQFLTINHSFSTLVIEMKHIFFLEKNSCDKVNFSDFTIVYTLHFKLVETISLEKIYI